MSENWAERQRRTNRLTRILGDYLLNRSNITPRQLYGLSKLTWITNSYEDEAAGYIRSTKIPALEDIFERDFSAHSLNEVAIEVGYVLSSKSVGNLILQHTGFTNFYKAYRNSVNVWIEENHVQLLNMYRNAMKSKSNDDRRHIIDEITSLPGIPKANHAENRMKPEYFLTPTFFALDPEIKFPLINGNAWVKNLLDALKVTDSGLVEQYCAMTSLYGVGGISDAADLDQVGRDLPDFLSREGRVATKQLLESKATDGKNVLPLKDEDDVEAIKKAGLMVQRRIHNRLTNQLRIYLSKFTLLEGKDKACMFDVLVKEYDLEYDLLIEVKSSSEVPHVRMAIGQLFDYCMKLDKNKSPHLAVLLPEKPNEDVFELLAWLNIGLMWFNGETLHTKDDWLLHLC